MDEVEEVLAMMAREGMPNEKAGKQLKKIKEAVDTLKEKVRGKEKETEPMETKESEIYKKKIQEFEESLKVYQSGLKKEAYCFYITTGLEMAIERLAGVTSQLDKFDEQLADLFHIASNFHYQDDLNNSKKLMAAMREEVAIMRSLWQFEDSRIQVTESFLSRGGETSTRWRWRRRSRTSSSSSRR
jgi:dynein heavy chain